MDPMASFLRREGFRVVNLDYPSTRAPIDVLADHLSGQLDACCSVAAPLHFVTHSLGGIVLRYAHAKRPIAAIGRVVMLAPPSQGSELVDLLEAGKLEGVLGPSGRRLGTGPTGIPAKLRPVDFELGIISGDRTLNPIGSWLIPGPDDGSVSLERAKTEGMADFIVIPRTHSFIMFSGEAQEEAAHFLKHGAFRRPAPSE